MLEDYVPDDFAKSALPQGFELSRDNFLALIPKRPYCTDDLSQGLGILPRQLAVMRSHIQLNGPSLLRWMIFDLDYRGAYLVHRDALVPQPNVMMIRRTNGHGHAVYLLENAVAKHEAARVQPLRYFAAVERGLARRTGADRRYRGLIAKNPLHMNWEVEWRHSRPYSLPELADWLSVDDMRPDIDLFDTMGSGRNCELFDHLRRWAYGEARIFKRRGEPFEEWQRNCLRTAVGINNQFSIRLGPSEVGATVRSVSKWTWRRFGEVEFSRIQSVRGSLGAAKRWADYVTAREVAKAAGLSRSTYYRHRRRSLND